MTDPTRRKNGLPASKPGYACPSCKGKVITERTDHYYDCPYEDRIPPPSPPQGPPRDR